MFDSRYFEESMGVINNFYFDHKVDILTSCATCQFQIEKAHFLMWASHIKSLIILLLLFKYASNHALVLLNLKANQHFLRLGTTIV